MTDSTIEFRSFDGSLWRAYAETSLGDSVRLERSVSDPVGVEHPSAVLVVPAALLRLALALHSEIDD